MAKSLRIWKIFILSTVFILFLVGTHLKIKANKMDIKDVEYVKSEKEKNCELEVAIYNDFELEGYENSTRYYYNRIDLNGDDKLETFVYLTGPFVCGTGGCSGAIYEMDDGEYKMVTRFSLVRTPIIVMNSFTNEWRDIVMYVSGGGVEGEYRLLRFSGSGYPSNPSIVEAIEEDSIFGTGIISDTISSTSGLDITCTSKE
ncbi:hypothetical protein [Bacillus coahuilensis]|uniref:hypothetical protein n=1 Tax=Bacillus coahuilensis TaxID=408580 RepID=UPI0002DA46B5|nr:hypothetical protein [Bacillus coahuilensis]